MSGDEGTCTYMQKQSGLMWRILTTEPVWHNFQQVLVEDTLFKLQTFDFKVYHINHEAMQKTRPRII